MRGGFSGRQDLSQRPLKSAKMRRLDSVTNALYAIVVAGKMGVIMDGNAGIAVSDQFSGGFSPPPNYEIILKELKAGKVIPFLGAGASIFHGGGLVNRSDCPPSTAQLASRLADKVPVPTHPEEFLRIREDLSRVASVFQFFNFDRLLLNGELTDVFNRDFEPNILHTTLAQIALHRPFLIITTNYDDMIERAFDTAGARYHLLVTCVENLQVKYKRAGEEDFDLVDAAQLKSIPQGASIIYKMHGSVERGHAAEDSSFVITEEDYLAFLTNAVAVPAVISGMFHNRRFLLLGYSMRDWNFRAMLNHRLQEKQRVRSWGVQDSPNPIDRKLWDLKQVTIYDMDLMEFSKRLADVFAAGESV